MGLSDISITRPEEKKRPKKIGCHGSHWDTLLTSESEVQAAVVNALEQAESLKMVEKGRRTVLTAQSGGEALKTCTVVVDQELCTGYPFITEGVVHEVEVEEVDEWMNEVEGQVRGRIGEARVAFFDTLYFKNREQYRSGGRYRFALSALAYQLRRANPGTVTGPDGKKLSPGHMAAYLPFRGGDVDDFIFQTEVNQVKELTFRTRTVYQITVPLFREMHGEEEDDVEIVLYAAEHVTGGYVPKVGDLITGAMWLQGHLVEGS
ncbi:hypothetical protein E2N92_12740 [Methanofollis formosanus]|uniref:Uncharacterized protein n=1 Tax=Methanofollis formosanus TaxID=299308 RepID=A0A8G1EHG1_9EURY|nr:hypothetical protein [Methanofollis formosanus]QYZ80234.1 hypothetical protein E2N92_12740 [Methanofollis formosanus]